MDITPKSKKPMTRDEVALFVELVQNYSVLTSKETNASTNKLKEEAWVSLMAAFNAKCGSFPKQKDQLKLKWDNLKKAARKRSQQIRMNNLKTGGGKPDFIPPDEILDKVASMMGSTCTGFDVPFGGDGYGGGSVIVELHPGLDEESQEQNNNYFARMEVPDEENLPNTSAGKRKINFSSGGDTEGIEVTNQGTKMLYGLPTMAKPLQNKAKKKKLEDGRLERNLAIAKYYNKKAEKLDLEIKILQAELANKGNNHN